MSTSKIIDEVFSYFRKLGTSQAIDEKTQERLFTSDFQMIINGKSVLQTREALTPHFEHIFAQVSKIDLVLHDKIVAGDTAIMRYDLNKPEKSDSKVIAIFKFKNDQDGQWKTYEMNEVVYSVNPQCAVDVSR